MIVHVRKGGTWTAAAALVLASLLGSIRPAGALLPSPTVAPIDAVLAAALASGGTVRAAIVLDAVASPAQLQALRAAGLAAAPFSVLPMVAVEGPAVAIRTAAALPFVRSLWGNHPLEEAVEQSTAMIQADDVYAAPMSVTGEGVRIAVLDSGIDATHPDLELGTKVVENVKLLGYTKLFRDQVITVEQLPNTDTTSGHGTHVAGIAAGSGALSGGRYAGVAPGADLVGVGAADGMEMLTALGGYDWILANRDDLDIRVINNSWADGKIAYDPSDPLNVASKMAHDAGITVVFAAGNDGKTAGNVYNRYAWPEWVVGVGGVDKLGRPGDYSSRGDGDHHPTVSAPGSFIASARAQTSIVGTPNQTPFDLTDPAAPRMVPPEWWPYYTVKLGTSMSAPHVAGVVALMLEANPLLTPDQVKAILAETAVPVQGCAPADCGAGIVSALGAVMASVDAANDPPVGALAASVSVGAAPLETVLDASASTDDSAIASYRWDLDGDGAVDRVTSEPVVSHTYPAGSWTASVTVIDDDGLAGTPVSALIRASDPPVASAAAPKSGKGGRAVTIDASGSTDPDGSIVSYTFTFGDGTELTSSSPVVTHTWSPARPMTYAWSVVVTDDAGITDGVAGTIKITP